MRRMLKVDEISQRARDLLEDIEGWNPDLAEKLMRHGKKMAIKTLEEYLEKMMDYQAELEQSLLERMNHNNNPMEAIGNQAQARMMAQEIVNGEINKLLRPETTDL